MCVLCQICAQNDYLKLILRKISWVLKYSFHFCELGFGPSRPPFGSNEVSLESRGTWQQTQVFAHTHTHIYLYLYLCIYIFMSSL